MNVNITLSFIPQDNCQVYENFKLIDGCLCERSAYGYVIPTTLEASILLRSKGATSYVICSRCLKPALELALMYSLDGIAEQKVLFLFEVGSDDP